jgi:hypothetical protein
MNESPENKANLRLFRYSLYNSNNWYVMLDAPVAKLACQNNKVHSVYHLRLESWLAYSSVLLMMCWFWVLSFECRPFCCSPSCHVDFVVKCTRAVSFGIMLPMLFYLFKLARNLHTWMYLNMWWFYLRYNNKLVCDASQGFFFYWSLSERFC